MLLAKKARVPEVDIVKLLQRLEKDGILAYKAQQGDLEICFLLPREDDRTINRFAHLVREQQRLKAQHLESVLDYSRNKKRCRSRQLLAYFGEESFTDCGSCDVCLSKNRNSRQGGKSLEQDIINALGARPLSSRMLIQKIDSEEGAVLGTLQLLLEAGHIRINTKNEYSLN